MPRTERHVRRRRVVDSSKKSGGLTGGVDLVLWGPLPPIHQVRVTCWVAVVASSVAIGIAAGFLRFGLDRFPIITAIGFSASVAGAVATAQDCINAANYYGFGCHGFNYTYNSEVYNIDWCDNVVYPWSAERPVEMSDVPMAA